MCEGINTGVKKLHLGCFDQIIPGWINTDITPHIFIGRIPGLAWLLFKLGIISKQRYEQLLEHLFPDQARFCVQEIYRVLKRGGIVRISVPDLDKVVASYDPSHPQKFLENIFGTSQKLLKNRHHWHYNEISLRQLLQEAGFSLIYRCEFRQGQCVDVALIDNRPDSLFMEAVK